MSSPSIPASDLDAAIRRLRERFAPSPLLRSRALSERIGADAWLKLERELPTGSFKVRGAYHALSRRREGGAGAVREVVAASTGNHGAAVAWAARELGVAARIFVPAAANAAKTARIRSLGAALVEQGGDIEAARRNAEAYVAETGALLLDDATDADIPVGAGTIGVEILEQCPGCDAVVVPVGDSALIRGVAAAMKGGRPALHVTGVQASGAPAYYRSWHTRAVVTTETADTIADGLATTRPTEPNVAAMLALVDEMVLVSEEEMLDAMRWLRASEGIVAEPAAAASVAALLRDGGPAGARAVVALVTGGNVAPEVERVVSR